MDKCCGIITSNITENVFFNLSELRHCNKYYLRGIYMRKSKVGFMLVFVLVLSMFLSACNSGGSGGTTTTPSGEDVIKIAVAAPQTGDNSEYGIGFANAAELMAESWNANGGINGKTISIVKFDDKNSPEEGVSVANKIVSEGDIPVVIGHFASGVCLAAAPIYQENKIIEISPSASHPDYSGVGDFIFRNNTVINTEASASVDIAVNDLGKSNIGIISIKTDWGVSTAEIVKNIVESEFPNASVVAHEEVIEGSDDYRPAISKLNDANAEVVICVGMYNLVAPVARQYKEVNPEIEIVGFSNAYSQQLIELGGEGVEGVAFPVIFFSQSEDEKVSEFVNSFKEKYGSEPSALTAQAYDSVGIFLKAVEKVGLEDQDAIRDEIAALEYDGVTGYTKFDENGDVQKSFTKVIVRDGKFELLKWLE